MLSLLLQTHRRRGGGTLLAALGHLGAAGLFFLAVIDSSPLPTFEGPDILIAILAASHRSLWYEYAATAIAGSLLGAYFTFKLAREAGEAYLDKKFRKSTVSRFLRFFRKRGTSTLFASAAIPLPTPTSMFFAAAGVSDYPRGKFLVLVAIARGIRYVGVAYVAGHYGGQFLRVLRHPLHHWGWLLLFLALAAGFIVGGFIASRRLDASPEQEESRG